MRGRDVKRWRTQFAEQYLIKIESSENTNHPWSGKSEKEAEKIFAATYPAIHEWFEGFRSALKKRDDQGKYFWELRSCAYWKEFDQPKLVVPAISGAVNVALDDQGSSVSSEENKSVAVRPALAPMSYPANELDKLICAAALSLVHQAGDIGSVDHLEGLLLATHRDWCRALLPVAKQAGFDVAVNRAPQALAVQPDQSIHWKRCRDYLEKQRKAISVQRPGTLEQISRAPDFDTVRKTLPSGINEMVKYALMALDTVRKIRGGNLASTTPEQQNMVQTLMSRSRDAELVT